MGAQSLLGGGITGDAGGAEPGSALEIAFRYGGGKLKTRHTHTQATGEDDRN